MRFWVLGFQGFATYPNFKVLAVRGSWDCQNSEVLGFQGLTLHIKILRSWVSNVLRHNTILRSWVSRVPRQKGRARSKIHQGPRPWTQRTQDLEPFWNLGTSLIAIAFKLICKLAVRSSALFGVRPLTLPTEHHLPICLCFLPML